VPDRERNAGRAYRVRGDTRVAEVASRQDGVIGREQLREAGLGADAVRRRVEAGRLHPIFEDAFAVGHRAITRDGWFSGALLSVGDDAALGFFSAVQHYEMWEGRVGIVHVVVTRRRRDRERIRFHWVSEMPPCRVIRGIRVVEPAIAVLQFAACVKDANEVRRVAREAQFKKRLVHHDLVRVCEEHAGARGAGRLRRAIRGGPAPTRNGGEDLALELLRECGLDPLVNADLLGFQPDFYVPELQLVIEFDGWVHDIPLVSDDDHRRQAVFEAAGYRVIRIDWDDLTVRREQTRRRILAASATQNAHTASRVTLARTA
jgi:hypothetical protein